MIWLGSCLGKGTVCFSSTSRPPVFEIAIAWIWFGNDDIALLAMCTGLAVRCADILYTRVLAARTGETEKCEGVLEVDRKPWVTALLNMREGSVAAIAQL